MIQDRFSRSLEEWPKIVHHLKAVVCYGGHPYRFAGYRPAPFNGEGTVMKSSSPTSPRRRVAAPRTRTPRSQDSCQTLRHHIPHVAARARPARSSQRAALQTHPPQFCPTVADKNQRRPPKPPQVRIPAVYPSQRVRQPAAERSFVTPNALFSRDNSQQRRANRPPVAPIDPFAACRDLARHC